MDQGTTEAFAALLIGLAFAGVVASGFEALAGRTIGLAMLRTGDAAALASVPLLVAAAPLLILRRVLRPGHGFRPNVAGVAILTVVAGCWSLACGRLVLDLVALATGA